MADTDARLTQYIVETVGEEASTTVNLTQYVDEVFTTDPGVPTRLTQYVVELLSVGVATPLRITQYVAEVFYLGSLPSLGLSGMYWIHPDKRNDTVYTSISSDVPPVTTSEDRAIPNPFVEGALIGDK